MQADIIGHVISVKNPRSGCITLDSVGEIIEENPVMACTGQVCIRDAQVKNNSTYEEQEK